MESVQDGVEGGELGLVPVGVVLVELGVEGVEVEEEVDLGLEEGLHAAVMVGGGVDVVDPDGIGAEGGHEAGVAVALFGVYKGVVWRELVSDAWM